MSGKLFAEDYKVFAPQFERLIQQHGEIRSTRWPSPLVVP
jgi:hypothetical protein